MYRNYEDIVQVRLVSSTKPQKDFDWLDDSEFGTAIENLVTYCARVSNPSNQSHRETNKRLTKYLLDNKHFSPFEMVHLSMEIVTCRDISRQILRHRSFSFQEYSQRYADPTQDLEFCIREPRMQDRKNRQNSTECLSEEIAEAWRTSQENIINEAVAQYKNAITSGVAKEVARCILPEGNTVTRMYMAGSLRSWIHYIELRCGNGTQKEHMLVAQKCSNIIKEHFCYL